MKKDATWLSIIPDLVKGLFSVWLITWPAFQFGSIGKTTEMGIAVAAGSIAACFINLDKFENFQGAGFRAELKKAVADAHATIDQLKQLAKPILLASLTTITYHKSINGIEENKEQTIMKELSTLAKEFSLENEKDLKQLLEDFYCLRLLYKLNKFRDTLTSDIIDSPDRGPILEQLGLMIQAKTFPSKELIYNMLGNNQKSLRTETTESLNNYLHYKQNNPLNLQND